MFSIRILIWHLGQGSKGLAVEDAGAVVRIARHSEPGEVGRHFRSCGGHDDLKDLAALLINSILIMRISSSYA